MHCFYQEKNHLAYRPLGYLHFNSLSFFEAFLWTLVCGQCANKVELYLKNDQKCSYWKQRFFPFQSRETLLSFFWRLSDVLECSANTSRHQEASNFGLNYLCKLALCSQLVCIIIFPAQSPSTIPICQNCNCNCRTFFGLHYCSMLSNVKMQNRKVRRKKKIQLCRSTLA